MSKYLYFISKQIVRKLNILAILLYGMWEMIENITGVCDLGQLPVQISYLIYITNWKTMQPMQDSNIKYIRVKNIYLMKHIRYVWYESILTVYNVFKT